MTKYIYIYDSNIKVLDQLSMYKKQILSNSQDKG